MSALDLATLYVRETYHEIAPDVYPEVEYPPGPILNSTEETVFIDDHTSSEGYRLMAVNELIEDNRGCTYRILEYLGGGVYSSVFKCQNMGNKNEFVALKVLKKQVEYRAAGLEEIRIQEEIASAPNYQGKDKIGLPITTFELEGHICIIMPIFQNQLADCMYQDQTLNLLERIRSITSQILKGLYFLHHIGIIHCDLKPENIMFKSQYNDDIVLIDFGTSTDQPIPCDREVQSLFYRAPEVMFGLPCTSKIDMWSVGCIAVEYYLDFAIFACDSEIDAIHTAVELLGPIDQNIIANSMYWWKFYDMSAAGYTLKMNPEEVMLTRHLYFETFQEIGAIPLQQMILEHIPPQNDAELNKILCFSHFVHSLLKVNQKERLSAAQALCHPFITGEPFAGSWIPPKDTTAMSPPLINP